MDMEEDDAENSLFSTASEGSSSINTQWVPKKKKHDNDNHLDFKICLDTKTTEARRIWCGSNSSETDYLKHCENSFCTFCCEG